MMRWTTLLGLNSLFDWGTVGDIESGTEVEKWHRGLRCGTVRPVGGRTEGNHEKIVRIAEIWNQNLRNKLLKCYRRGANYFGVMCVHACVHGFVYLYVCVCTYVCVCVCVCVCVYVCVCIYVCMYVYVCMYYVCMYVCTVCMYVCVCVCVCVCMYVCVYVCVYVRMYVCMYGMCVYICM